MSVWKGSREFLAGWIDITTPEADPEAEGDAVVFDPTRVVDGIELSDDPILRYRPCAASAPRLGRAPAARPTLMTPRVREDPRHRHRRPRARPRPRPVPRPGGHRGARRARQPRHRGGRHAARRRPDGRRRRRRPGRSSSAPTWSSSAPRRRWSPASPTPSARGASPASGRRGEAARLEGSKAFAKDVMAAAGVPTATARVCTTPEEVAAALDAFGPPYVVKDDGLAAGKGVVVTDDRDAALAHAARLRAGGRRGVPRRSRGLAVRDHRRHDGLPAAAGPGLQADLRRRRRAPTPAAWAPTRRCRGRRPAWSTRCSRGVLQPTVDEMARRGTPFAGLLYAGLALTSRGVRVVEFNARFGDPETQPLLALLDSPLARAAARPPPTGHARRRRRRRAGSPAPRSPW